MEKNWQNYKELIEYPRSGVLSKVLLKNDKTNITLFCMAQGTDIGEHTSTRPGLVLVVEGEGTFILGQESIRMVPGVMISMPANAVHALTAPANTSFLLFLL